MPDGLKLYLDQMFGLDVAAALRQEGYDVLRAGETGMDRADDALILEIAIREERVLVTLDEHFGDWVILPLKKHPGVIRLKINLATMANVVNLLLPFLRLYSSLQFQDHLVIPSAARAKWMLTSIP